MANNLRNASAPLSAILTDKDGITGAEVVSSPPSSGQTGLVVYTIPSATVLQVQDSADGSVGTAAPGTAIQVGARDPLLNLQALKVDNSGNLLVSGAGGGAGVQFADNAASGATPTGTLAEGWDSTNLKVRALKVDANQNLQVAVNSAVPAGSAVIGKVGMANHSLDDTDGRTAIGSEGLPLSQFQGTEFNELAVQDVNLARVLGSQDLTANGRLKVDPQSTDAVFQGFISSQRPTFSVPCAGYGNATIQIGGVWTGTISFECVASGSGATNIDPVFPLLTTGISSQTSGIVNTAATGIFRATTLGLSRIQVRFSTATSGTPQISITLSQAAIPTTVTVGQILGWANQSIVRVFGNAGAVFDAVVNTGAAPTNALWTEQAPATASAAALSVSAQSALTVANVKATAGNVYACSVQNPNASTIFIQFYNTAGTPTLGTSVIWWMPVGANATVFFGGSPFALANFATGIGVGAATTATGAGAPASAPAVVVHYL